MGLQKGKNQAGAIDGAEIALLRKLAISQSPPVGRGTSSEIVPRQLQKKNVLRRLVRPKAGHSFLSGIARPMKVEKRDYQNRI